MAALDEAEGLSARHLECFHYNFLQLTAQMITDARLRELRDNMTQRYPMGRKDWGAKESPEND